ncbi:MAG TPA: hypothetical protein VK498_01120 [Ferruginibacter sp.]|nr:hypothetical protein [Ferruginibacter sp.]
MKKIIFVFTCILVASTALAQEDSCLHFRTGKFSYMDDSSHRIIMKRTNHKQEERDEVSGTLTKFKVKWISGCEYQLTQVWSNSRKKRKQNHAVINVLITRVYGKMYEFTCACNSPGIEKKKGKVFMIN